MQRFSNVSTCNIKITLSQYCVLLQHPAVGYGMGRKGKLAAPITIHEAVNKVKAHLGLPHVRVALAKNSDMCKYKMTFIPLHLKLYILHQAPYEVTVIHQLLPNI